MLDIPLKIMEKYKGEGTDGRLFYVPATSSLCRSLKIIGDICGLDCHLTYYMARHTYATEICLSNGVPIETISRMMGHSNIRYSLPEDNMPSRVYRCGQYSGWKKECGRQKDGTDS